MGQRAQKKDLNNIIWLVFIQSDTSSIFIDASLVFIALGLAKINKDKGRKFDYYAWLGIFILFLILFIFKAFILV